MRAGLRLLALQRLLNGGHIREILRSSGRQLRRYQVFAGNEGCLQSTLRVDNILNPALPCRIELNARYRGQNVNADWLTAHAKERAPRREIGGGKTLERRSELR